MTIGIRRSVLTEKVYACWPQRTRTSHHLGTAAGDMPQSEPVSGTVNSPYAHVLECANGYRFSVADRVHQRPR